MFTKLSKKDGQRIWRNMKRFAEYTDLKDLYSRCIPEIVKFDGKIMELQCNVNDFTEIIRRFDEHLTQKVDKSTMYKLSVD